MTATTVSPGWFAQTERWLDNKGKGAWFVALILGFILFWPLGLAILIYMIWSNRMSRSFFCSRSRSPHRLSRHSSGNAAFDAYRDDTLHRLEEEQTEFRAFLTRLRDAKDKAEFDSFLADRAKAETPVTNAPA